MRWLLFALLVTIGSGCSRREPSPLQVQVTPTDPNSGASPGSNPVDPTHEEPKSLLNVDFVALWDRTGPIRLSPEEQEYQHHGRVVYADHAEECFAVEMVGAGSSLGGPLLVLARNNARPEVTRRMRAVASEPFTPKPSGGLLASGQFDGKKTTVIAVVEQAVAADERFRRFIEQEVTPIVAQASGTAATPGPVSGFPSGAALAYRLPDRTGTITLALLPPAGDKKVLDSLISPADVLGRSLLAGRREGEALLLIIVEEQRQ